MYHEETERGTSGGTELIPSSGSPSRPVVRYHGGKWKLAPWIIEHFPSHRIYVEAFSGGGSVLLRKEKSYAEVYNDLDGEIVNLFRVIRDNGLELIKKLELTPFAREEYQLSFEVSDDPIEQARRTLLRSHAGFGSNALCRAVKSGFRANSDRNGTTPAKDWRNYPDNIPNVIDRLRGVIIENRPAVDVMKAHDSTETLHYVDPPYVHDTRSKKMHGHHGYNHEMTDGQHVEMAEVLNGLAGMVVLSGYRSELYDKLFAGWERVERRALADGAKERTECLWLRNVKEAQTSLW